MGEVLAPGPSPISVTTQRSDSRFGFYHNHSTQLPVCSDDPALCGLPISLTVNTAASTQMQQTALDMRPNKSTINIEISAVALGDRFVLNKVDSFLQKLKVLERGDSLNPILTLSLCVQMLWQLKYNF